MGVGLLLCAAKPNKRIRSLILRPITWLISDFESVYATVRFFGPSSNDPNRLLCLNRSYVMQSRDTIDLFAVTRGITGRKAIRERTMHGYVLHARQFCVYMHNPEIVSIKAFDCEEFMRDMEDAGLSINNSRQKGNALRQLFRFLKKRGYTVLDPEDIPIPVKERVVPRVASDEDIAKVLKVLPESSDDKRIIRD